MKKTGIAVLFLLAGAVAGFGAEGKGPQAGKEPVPADVRQGSAQAIAEVNGRIITHQQLYDRLLKLNGREILNQMIDEMLVEDEAKAGKISIADGDIEKEVVRTKKLFESEEDFNKWLNRRGLTLNDLKAQIQTQILREKLLIKEKGINVTGKEIEDYFEKNKADLAVPEQWRARHILVSTKEKADDLLVAIRAGADFAAMAKAKSEDVASRDTGGDIGYFSKGKLLPEFEEAAFKLKAGEVSGPVKTKLGFHIIKLEEQKKTVAAKLDNPMKEKIKELLTQQRIAASFSDWLKSLRERAKIKIY